jgi:tyrosine-protein phosphatase SIW14
MEFTVTSVTEVSLPASMADVAPCHSDVPGSCRGCQAADIPLASLEHAARNTETPDIALRDVYQSAKDVIGNPRSLPFPVAQPENFGRVAPGVYRSSYPQAADFTYLGSLKLKTIITLVQKDIPREFQDFIDGNGIRHYVFDMAGTKKAEIPLDLMQSIIGLVADESNHPLLIHCNHGKHRTGCVVGVYRKWKGWDSSSILAEYTRFAEPKARPTDIQYLSDFQLAHVRHILEKKLPSPSFVAGQFFYFTVVAAVCLFVWLVTAKTMVTQQTSFPPLPPKQSVSEQQL